MAAFDYQPGKCRKSYRVVVVRKNLTIERGERALFDRFRHFYYITNIRDASPADIVALANGRCDQENLIAQLKGQLQAMKMPTKTLLGNWTYLAIGCLAWNLKAWLALTLPKKLRPFCHRSDFSTFYRDVIHIPAQILTTGRRTIFRLLGYRAAVPWLLEAHRAIS